MNGPVPSLPWQIAGAALTGVAVVLAFPGFGFEVGLDWLVWVALVPLFLAATGRGWKRGLLLGWCAGLILEAAGFCWIYLAIRRFTGFPDFVAALLFSGWLLYASVPWALLGLALGRCRFSRQVIWLLPVWVAIEGLFPRLFPWHLGGALYGRSWLLQGADLLGASGLTALVFLINAFVHELLQSFRGGARRPYLLGAVALTLVAAALFYGQARLAAIEELANAAPRLNVLCVQGAIDPRGLREGSLETYVERTRELLRVGPMPDLIVWPEGSDQYVFDLTPGRDSLRVHKQRLPTLDLPRVFPVPLVGGGAAGVLERVPISSNAAFYLEPGGDPQFYEKNCRLLFGEQLPLVDLLPEGWRKSIYGTLQFAGTIAAGKTQPIFRLGETSFRCLICYEAVLPGYIAASSRAVDFLVNVTEDMWYGRTAHVTQHASVLILRVVENRTPLVRAANAGPSGVLDITGRFERGATIFEPEGVRAVLRARQVPSLYASWGRFFPQACGLAVAVWVVVVRWRRHQSHPSRLG